VKGRGGGGEGDGQSTIFYLRSKVNFRGGGVKPIRGERREGASEGWVAGKEDTNRTPPPCQHTKNDPEEE